jgi:hypothetical protein
MTELAKVEGQTIEIDTEGMERRLGEKLGGKMKEYFAELKRINESKQKQERGGKGVIESHFSADQKTRVVEEFQKGEKCDPRVLKEQWTICIPYVTQYERAAHLRDFVWVTDVVKGKPGETVNIPYVKDVEFQHVVAKTGTFAGKSNLVNVLTTTLHEAGTYYDAYYGDIEKIDSNMLDEINRVFAHAAIRAEDYDLVNLLNDATSGNFVMTLGGGTLAPIYVGTDNSSLLAAHVVDALAAMMKKGKEVHPGECVLLMNAAQWETLANDVIGSTPMQNLASDFAKTGLLESFLGVKIIVPGCRVKTVNLNHATPGTTYDCVYLLRPKRALALAPKRDILIETDKLIHLRQLRIAASHTFGVAALDLTDVVPIKVEDKTAE